MACNRARVDDIHDRIKTLHTTLTELLADNRRANEATRQKQLSESMSYARAEQKVLATSRALRESALLIR